MDIVFRLKKDKKKANLMTGDLLKVPGQFLNGMSNISFRTIAFRLEGFKSQLLNQTMTRQFLSNPYRGTVVINDLDKLWTRLANAYVNYVGDIPSGYGKRLTFCTNDGYVFIDVSTYNPDFHNTKNLNYSMITVDKLFYHISPAARIETGQNTTVIDTQNILFNPENTNVESIVNGKEVKRFVNIRCGSAVSPNRNKNDLTSEETQPVNYTQLDLESTRSEYIQTFTKKYGFASRYSNTIFAPSYYVATKINGADGYEIFIRLSYYLM